MQYSVPQESAEESFDVTRHNSLLHWDLETKRAALRDVCRVCFVAVPHRSTEQLC